ncbi:MAG: transposase [Candidatus Omnitrophica bacterium]|nr:transposase [Candidatus Omnitrophota bacterium]
MGRYARINHPGLIHHIIKRGNNREAVFLEEEDYRHYLNTIQRYKKKYEFKLYAYCLMTNHVHLLLETTSQGNISRIMQSITIAHIRYYNYKYQRCGHVWQGRFMSPVVSSDEYFLTAMRYIEQNPLRANMVKNVDEYCWSSYKLNIREKESSLIDRCDNIAFNSLGKDFESRVREYKRHLSCNLEKKQLDTIRETTRHSGNYVSKKFQEQFMKLLPQKRMRGRPREKEQN